MKVGEYLGFHMGQRGNFLLNQSLCGKNDMLWGWHKLLFWPRVMFILLFTSLVVGLGLSPHTRWSKH